MGLLKALQVDQRGIRLFLTTLSPEQIKRLRSTQQLEIEAFDPNKPANVRRILEDIPIAGIVEEERHSDQSRGLAINH